ncbi:MAG: hypothetical protein SGCHY_000885 [Lobulomycetales sp.]
MQETDEPLQIPTPVRADQGKTKGDSVLMERSNSVLRRDVLQEKNELGEKLIIVMVGLPARGKSYISKKLNRYLSWLGFRCRVFNVGNRRRVLASLAKSESDSNLSFLSSGPLDPSEEWKEPSANLHDAKFFDPSNKDAQRWREKLAMESLEELILWLHAGGKIGILDATNSTRERRKALFERVSEEKNVQCLFIESICTDGPVLAANIEMKLQGPDYINIPRERAFLDFKSRIQNYDKVYESLGEEEEVQKTPYIKMIDVGRKVISYNIQGYLPSHCVFYLMQLHIADRQIWITRHGESRYNVENRLGGDPNLTLTDPILANRTLETVESFGAGMFHITPIRQLNEIYSGSYENMTYDEFQEQYPEEFERRSRNKLLYRFPGAGGESYVDVIERLRPLIIELERLKEDVVICTHNVVMRTLVSYFIGLPLDKMPSLDIPLHTVFQLRPTP